MPVHPEVSGVYVCCDVPARVANMQARSARKREHVKNVTFGFVTFEPWLTRVRSGKGVMLSPILLPLCLNASSKRCVIALRQFKIVLLLFRVFHVQCLFGPATTQFSPR